MDAKGLEVAAPDTAGQRIERERDLYRGMLELSTEDRPEDFIERALHLVVQIVGAHKGYLELTDPNNSTSPASEGEEEGSAHWWISAGWSEAELAKVRGDVSSGIIAHAIAGGQVLNVSSAFLDPRFRELKSVRKAQIEAVLCVPIGSSPPLGVVYLQGRDGKGPFPEETAVPVAKLFARHLVPLAQRLFARYHQDRPNPTRAFRKRMNLEQLVGSSDALARLLRDVESVARLDVSLLITGETGTGKSQLARIVHQNSARRDGPLVEVNCAAIPENLVESELFGAVAGGHSTATTKIVGKVAAAEGGTLFLDEVAELPPASQSKLLTLLQSKEYYPLGSSKVVVGNVRVIAATNADLAARIKDGTFRQDLYYRLQVLPLKIPSLRERRDDIKEIAQYYCNRVAQQHGLPRVTLSPGALAALARHPWPGNVRQLENAIVAGTIRAAQEDAQQVEVGHLFPEEGVLPESRPTSFQEQTRRFQQTLLEKTLETEDWNIAATARMLDLTRAHVYNLIKQFGLSRTR